MRTGVGCAILPTSSSVCIIRLMRDANGCVTFLPFTISTAYWQQQHGSLCPSSVDASTVHRSDESGSTPGLQTVCSAHSKVLLPPCWSLLVACSKIV